MASLILTLLLQLALNYPILPPHSNNGVLHSLVVRQLWELDVGGSNPSAPTNLQARIRTIIFNSTDGSYYAGEGLKMSTAQSRIIFNKVIQRCVVEPAL